MLEATEREDMATTTAPVRDTIGAEQSLCETLLVLESNDGAPVLPGILARRRSQDVSRMRTPPCELGSPELLSRGHFAFGVRSVCDYVSSHDPHPRNP